MHPITLRVLSKIGIVWDLAETVIAASGMPAKRPSCFRVQRCRNALLQRFGRKQIPSTEVICWVSVKDGG
jgi:hypothetical protein